MNWLFIGSSRSVLDTLPQARIDWPGAITVTANAGIELDPDPDYYFVVDQVAAVEYAERAYAAQRRGTHLVSLWRDSSHSREERRINGYDTLLRLPDHDAPTRLTWGKFHYTGPLAMEYALRHGATRLILVGCDGYTGEDDDYFSFQEFRKTKHAITRTEATDTIIRARTQELVRLWPEVPFVVYGNPVYQIDGENWQVINAASNHSGTRRQ